MASGIHSISSNLLHTALQRLTKPGVPTWCADQVLKWVALADLPPESVPVVCAALGMLDCDGEELLVLPAKILQKNLAKSGADDATTLAKQVLEQRDALASDDSTTPPAGAGSTECPICFEHYIDDESGKLVPRFLSCGHTVCNACIANMLTRVNAVGHMKPFGCRLCHTVTEVRTGKASELPKNFCAM